jgi:hypothetical protein
MTNRNGCTSGGPPAGWGLLAFAALFLVTRLALAGVLYSLTDGHEFTDDAALWFTMARYPWANLTGDLSAVSPSVAHHPPFAALGVVPLIPLGRLMGPFLAIRALFALFETIAVVSALSCVHRHRTRAAVLLLLAPFGWMTTSVFAQEEYLTGFLLLLAATGLAVRTAPRWGKAVILTLPVLFGKIFAAFALAAYLPLLWKSQRSALKLAIAILLLVLGAWAVAHAVNQGALPGFESLGAAYQPLSPVALGGAILGLPSLPLRIASLAVSMLLIVWLAYSFRTVVAEDAVRAARLACLNVVVFVLLFHHTFPEYLAWITPLLVVATDRTSTRSWSRAWAAWLLATTSGWVLNVSLGLSKAAGSGDSGKSALLALYEQVFPVGLLPVANGLACLGYVTGLGLLWWQLQRSLPEGNVHL